MIKKIVKAAVVLLIFALQPEILAQTTWHNPEEAGFHVLQGRRYNGEARERFYHRFPAKAKETVRKAVWSQSVDAAGESIVFTTDANEITVRYTVNKRHAMPHMPATGVTGVDLYTADRNGDEIWLAGKYSFKDTVVFSYKEIDIEKKPKAHRYTLFLPLYNEVKWMEIGTNEGAEFRFEPIPEEKPIVAYGTSICHGACASRPGMAWTNILQRRLGHEVVNLGFSGNAKLETEVMDLISQIDAKVYIIDAMPNSYVMEETQLKDSLAKAVRYLRSKRPETPILLADHLGYPHAKVVKRKKDDENRAWNAQKAVYDLLIKEGMKNLYHLTHNEIALPQDGTVEGIHASDYGMKAYADAYEKILRDILKEPVGERVTTRPAVQQRDPYDWMARHLNSLKAGKGKHFDRVIIGDSIIHFWGGADDAPATNGEQVWNEFEGTTLNLGYGCDMVENVLWRIYHGELDNLTTDKIFLAIGTNNLRGRENFEDITEGIKWLLTAIKERQPDAEITLMGLLPRRNREAEVKDLNKMLKVLAKEMKTNFADPGRKLLLKNGKIDESLFTDGLHPTNEGYRLIAPYFK